MAVLFSTFPVAQSIPEQFQLQVFDVKFPCVILPYESMTQTSDSRLNWGFAWYCCYFFLKSANQKTQVRRDVNRLVASLMAWSISICAGGVFPHTGFAGEAFDPKSLRHSLMGKVIANGWRQGSL